MRMRKAIVLFSEGLDSLLTLAILKRQGIEPIALHFRGWFLGPKFRDFDAFPEEENRAGITIVHQDISREYTRVLLHARFGRGKGANPCVDCKLFFLVKARELMEERGASFVATGEVCGQRPMSQRPQIMDLLEKRSGLQGYLLRPLSARLLPPTIPEELGWIEREGLYDIQGRSRKRQLQLAQEFGIQEYPSPAGGCLLADPNYGRRFQDLINHKDDPQFHDLIILKYGRHLRIGERCKLVVGKNQTENQYLERLEWGNVSIDAINPAGPFSRLEWDGKKEHLLTALEVIARYCSSELGERTVKFAVRKEGREEVMMYSGIPDREKIEGMLIC